jgi:protein-S-isoprenylcysteine O-methyltransferase Ste14
MNTTQNPHQQQSKKVSVPWWIGFVIGLTVWEVLPWAISLLTPRYGWTASYPSSWNLLGLIPVVAGTIGFIWGMRLHFPRSRQGIEWELEKSYLLMRGPYAISRHPMYLSELTLMLGWVIFYGSIAILITFVVAWSFFNFYAMPTEERAMEARFGESYLEYKRRVARWFRKR